jgi:hypothetical protein
MNRQCCFRHKKSGRLRSRINSWGVLSQRPKRRPTESYTNRAGPQTTPDAPANRQLHCIRYLKRNNKTNPIKSNGYAKPLDNRESPPKTVWRLLNYSHSRNPPCTPARTHGQIQAPRGQPNQGVCSRACTLSQYRTKLLLLSHNFSNSMINSTSLNEAQYTLLKQIYTTL